MRTRQTQLLLRTKVLKLDVTITCKDVASSKYWWHAWAPSHFWMEPSPIEGDSLLTLIQTPFWDNLWQTKTSIHHTQGPPIRKPRTGWSLSQSNAEVLHRSEHGRANPEDARHIHKPFRIPDKKCVEKCDCDQEWAMAHAKSIITKSRKPYSWSPALQNAGLIYKHWRMGHMEEKHLEDYTATFDYIEQLVQKANPWFDLLRRDAVLALE